jgi:acetyl-CoA carboxylase biotin carboxyl carrier protein
MTLKEIQDLIKLIGKSNLSEFKLKKGDLELSIRTNEYGKIKTQQVLPPQPQMMQVPAPVEAPNPASSAQGDSTASETSGDNSAEADKHLLEVKSPIVGTFYRSASPDKPPYAKIGDVIEEGSVVCIVEAMKLFNEIESEVSGKIVKVLIEDASPVEYDQVLFLVDPNG